MNKNTFKRYFDLIICNLFSALVFTCFMKPLSIAAGGTGGVALVLNKVIDIDVNYIIYIIYGITFILSAIFLGKKSLPGVLACTILYPLFVSLTTNFSTYINMDYSDSFMIVIIGGVINGVCNGFIYKDGFASSGVGVIAPIFNKYFKVSISLTNFLISSVVVIMGGVYFGIDKVLYAIIYLYLNNIVSNKIILGVSFNRSMIIKSSKQDEIIEFLYNKYNIDSILINNCEEILITVPITNYENIKNEIILIDNDISFVSNNAYEVVS